MSETSRRDREAVVAHYTRYSERERFDHVLGELERVRTCEVLARHLPPTGVVLDIGGGPGAYARWIAERGLSVRLVDPVPRHVEEARELFAAAGLSDRAIAEPGHALDLPFESGSADAALLLGPLYHLQDRSDRLGALAECLRVLRSGAPLFAAGISRFASLVDGLDRRFLWDPVFEGIVRADLASGRHENPTGSFEYFTHGFFHRPSELTAEVEEAGFVDVRVLAVETVLWANRQLEEDWQDDRRRALLLELAREVEGEPELVGASPHLLAVARRP